MTSIKKIEIKELDPDIIPPITSRFSDPNYNGGSKIVVVGKPGCFAPGTKVMLYDGTIKMVEDIVIGDQLMGDDSTSRNVLELCHDSETMYKIIPYEGNVYTVNENHILSLKSENNDIIDITVKDFLDKPYTYQKTYKWYHHPVEFPDKKIQFDPYMLGYSIGLGKEKIFNSTKINIIPHAYKTNSRKIRLELLAGIIDSEYNFSYSSELNKINLSNKNEENIDSIVFIARSLGLYSHKHSNCSFYSCCIYGDLSIIPSHNKKFVRQSNNILFDFTIEKLDVGEYYGFVLDGNHRFLGEDFSVLHNTGKSTVIKSILYAKKHIFPIGIAMSGSEDSNHCYGEFMPSTFVFNEYDEEKISQMVKRQKLAANHLPNPWAFMILDDCTDDPKIFNRPLQQALYKKGRHWNLLYILSLQYAMDIKPVIRTNVDGIFILREPLLKNREALYKNYASIIPDFTTFCSLMDQLTEDFHCMYIHGATNVNNWCDCVYWYKAPLTPKGWKVGAPEFWEFHYARYNDNYTDNLTGY